MGLDELFGHYYRITIRLECTVKILVWIKIAKISDPFNTMRTTGLDVV